MIIFPSRMNPPVSEDWLSKKKDRQTDNLYPKKKELDNKVTGDNIWIVLEAWKMQFNIISVFQLFSKYLFLRLQSYSFWAASW